MTAGRTEDVEEQLARAVDNRGLLLEAGRARDEAQHREDSFDAVETPELGTQDRERVERAPVRRLGSLLHLERRANNTGMHEPAVETPRQLARRACATTMHHHRVERIVGRVR